MTTHKQVRSTEEALELALECAERCENIDGMYSWSDTITAIKASLEAHKALMSQSDGTQPSGSVEQEPVAWQVEFLIQGIWSPIGNPQRNKDRAERLADNPSIPKECQRIIELYTTPPQRKPMRNVVKVERTSDQSVKLVFTSCAAASEFENSIKE